MRSTSSCIDTGKGFCLPQTTWYFFWATAIGIGIIGGSYLRLRLRLIERWSTEEELGPWAAGLLITLAWAHSAEVILLGAVPGAAAGVIGRRCWNDW